MLLVLVDNEDSWNAYFTCDFNVRSSIIRVNFI